MCLGVFVVTAKQVKVEIVVRFHVTVRVHRHKASVLQKAGVDATTCAGILRRHGMNQLLFEPLKWLGGCQTIDLGR